MAFVSFSSLLWFSHPVHSKLSQPTQDHGALIQTLAHNPTMLFFFFALLLGRLGAFHDPSIGPKPQGARLVLLCGPH